ncbi:SGNH/GDSL hydrolase family protein [Variovorax sp. J22R115]|uniref:SGNH/GDSL hydrolase family protein n=1 Tax=Variovorax sp. J22R115 TaxID=3053509 RepID=UPI00257587F0|nr:SGNH/GDSL hydrolase family protein [Variovorax sp. J22R115]MDM0050406.1 SGNH/GDSL hydrolase family protein [Variovorax sp. J22R115]
MMPVLVAVLLAGFLAGCGGGGDGGSGSTVLATIGKSVAVPDASPAKGQEDATLNKPAEDSSLCTVEIYGDSIMAFNGTATTPVMMLQLVRPNLLVVADHSVLGMSLGDLAAPFPYFTRSAHFVIIENGVIDAWAGRNINTVISEYYAIIQKVRDEGRVPVLTGFSRQARGGPLHSVSLQLRDFYDAVIQAIATNNGVPFADWGSVPFYGAWDLIDFVHPNKNYSDRLVGRLAMTLDPLTTNCTNILAPAG